ncbi:MAG: hypothetical protein B7Y25_01090 [Alphaproteobacteria bacterium 16-39-46]|nr:MAG: hypothetical protein B7Y25_01090 [Alphaproteobacteria bacterium 16-39-46]OZA44217.1 MAG: hypothetical protein B7X84_01170 [Alphaproteobacteria bacterium 17-39-52]HQS84945.1 GNAT family N-acetyltransferase [Alphaproteobacteria bacterium]HQS94711.1 GNAT family N-acetyltransferase [Alphaproteobacteria bacterium]
MIQIKKAHTQDIPFIALLWKDKLQAPWTEEMIKDSFDKENVVTMIAVSETPENGKQRCVGFLMASFLEEAELYALVVKKIVQRQGIGQRLLENLLDFLKDKNVSSLFLEVSVENTKALSFYEKREFKKVGERPHYYLKEKQENEEGSWVTALVLRKSL